MDLGQITVSDIFLVLLGVFLSGGVAWFFIHKKTKNRNILKGNIAGGDMAGGNIDKSGKKSSSQTVNKNVLKKKFCTRGYIRRKHR